LWATWFYKICATSTSEIFRPKQYYYWTFVGFC